MIPYSVMTQKVLRNGKERKLTPTQRVAVGAVYSFSTEERSADFTCRELAERYRVSESSAFRSLKAARDVGLIKRADKVSDYDFEGTDDGGHLRVREWAYYAKFEFSNGKAEYLIHNEILVLFYIISQCRGKKGADIWRASLRHISRRLNISATTVSSAVARLKSARLIYVSGRAKNKNSRATFSVNQEAVKAAEEAVKTRYKGQAESVKEADERAAREQYFAHYHAAAIERAEQMNARARADEAYRSAEAEIRKLDVEIAKAEINRLPTLPWLIEKQRAAQKRRAERLAAMGLTEEDLAPQWHCTKCSDSGFLPDGRACDCYPTRGRP